MSELAKTVGYCGLVCGVCVHACRPDCRGGGGAEDCYQRKCCQAKGIDGCWECEGFPCNNGFFAEGPDPAWRGLCIGSIRGIRECGIEEYVVRVLCRMGNRVDYGDYRYQKSEEIVNLLGCAKKGESDP